MASKMFCDGCDKEIVDQVAGARTSLEVKFSSRQGDQILGQFARTQDLCQSCIVIMKEKIDAKSWPRAAKSEHLPSEAPQGTPKGF